MHYLIELEGLKPGLVMNRRLPESNKVLSAEAEAEGHCFRLPTTNPKKKGELYMPGEWIKAGLLRVAGSPLYKIRLGAKKVSCKPYVAAGFLINPEKIPLGTNEYEVYTCDAVIMRKRIYRSRPRIFPWKVSFRMDVNDGDESFFQVAKGLSNVMADMIRTTAIMYGYGDNRPGSPSKPGPHGTARVLKCELIE